MVWFKKTNLFYSIEFYIEMMARTYQQVIYLSVLFFVTGNAQFSMDNKISAFDLNLYENVLDPKLCMKQIRHMAANNSVLLAQCEFENMRNLLICKKKTRIISEI